ncbi:MAG: DUF1801 domain-containing protein [Dehalococcoidia bacterium]
MATPRKHSTDGDQGFSAEERAAMQERARELRASSRRGSKADGEQDVLAKIEEMSESDRAIAARLHALIREHAPQLQPRTWYGMPAYALGKDVLCFFQPSSQFKARYGTLGFSDKAMLDDGAIWPTSFAVQELTPDVEVRIVDLVRRAASERS